MSLRRHYGRPRDGYQATLRTILKLDQAVRKKGPQLGVHRHGLIEGN